jgi:hypothetical protein
MEIQRLIRNRDLSVNDDLRSGRGKLKRLSPNRLHQCRGNTYRGLGQGKLLPGDLCGACDRDPARVKGFVPPLRLCSPSGLKQHFGTGKGFAGHWRHDGSFD